MPSFDETSAECLVYTFKDGILSAIGHDLVIRVGRLRVTVDPASRAVEAHLDASSLQVVSAARPGDPGQAGRAPSPIPLADGDKRKIEGSIRDQVLESRRYPEVRFSSTSVAAVNDGFRVTGTLMLHGRSREVTLEARPEGDRLVAVVTLYQPDFGIKPYAAMLGALRIKPEVKVAVSLPRAAASAG